MNNQMKQFAQALSLTLVLTSPMTMCLVAEAQPVQSAHIVESTRVADARNQQAWNAYAQSGYTYWDAKVLAMFWGQRTLDAKYSIGNTLMVGYDGKVALSQKLVDARSKAMATVDNLNLYADSGFSYADAKDLAEFWGDNNAWDGKVRIERNLILGNEHMLREALKQARR